MMSDGTPVESAESTTRVVKMGDVDIDPNKQAPAAAPTLGAPGPGDPNGNQNANRDGVMKPVHFPKQSQPGANPDDQQPAEETPAAGSGSSAGTQGPAGAGSGATAQTQSGAQQGQGQSAPAQAPAGNPSN
jgi:hypothetical protein